MAGGFLVYLPLFASARRSKGVPESKLVRVGLLLLAAFAGAAAFFFFAVQPNYAV